MVHITLPKQPINQFKPAGPVQQSRKQVLRAYCSNMYTVPVAPVVLNWQEAYIVDEDSSQ